MTDIILPRKKIPINIFANFAKKKNTLLASNFGFFFFHFMQAYLGIILLGTEAPSHGTSWASGEGCEDRHEKN